jgi:uncharacterized protein (TIGR00369 family)
MTNDINPAIGAMLKSARDWLTHEHSLFQSLNLDPILIGKGQATFAVDLPADFLDEAGAIHGGLMTIIMDSIFGLTVFTALEEIKPIATINLRSDYIADATAGERVICAAKCIKIRNQIAYVSGDVKTKNTHSLLATGSGAFMVGTRGPSKGSRL